MTASAQRSQRSARRVPGKGYTFNPPLVLVTNPAGFSSAKGGALSERQAWEDVALFAANLAHAAEGENERKLRASARVYARDLARIARGMTAQLARGVHRNPAPRSLPRGAVRFGSDVQAIVYRNTKVRSAPHRAHVFGGVPFDLVNHADGSLTIKGMVDRTGVECFGLPDGSALLRRKDGAPIVGDVPDTET